MTFLAAAPDITPITDLITTWIHIGQALVASIGALAFIFALAWMSKTLRRDSRDLDRHPPAKSSIARLQV
jgi:hypothetical protein